MALVLRRTLQNYALIITTTGDMSVPHKIPDLPSLPPLVMPSFPDATLTSPPSPDKVPSHVRQSPSLSVADSFSTAYTSAIPPDGLEETNHLGSSSLGLSQSLRKSVSVDSFAQCTGDESRSGPGDPSAGPSRNLVYGIPLKSKRNQLYRHGLLDREARV